MAKKDSRVPVKATKTSFGVMKAVLNLETATASAIAGELNLPTSTVYDHLRTLETEGYLEKQDKEYRLSPQLLEFGGYARSKSRLYQVGVPQVDDLADRSGEQANLMVENDGLGVFFYSARGEDALEFDTYSGMKVELHTTALGKAILANLPDERVDEIVDTHGLPAYNENTITDRAQLDKELDEVSERGYAIDNEERLNGVCCIAAPISSDESTGAISISGPTSRIKKGIDDKFAPMVIDAANVIEVNMTHL